MTSLTSAQQRLAPDRVRVITLNDDAALTDYAQPGEPVVDFLIKSVADRDGK